jgi:hypothetical protein
VGKIVTLGEVVAGAYEEQTPSEWSSSSKPARAATMRRSSVANFPSSSVICGDQAPL